MPLVGPVDALKASLGPAAFRRLPLPRELLMSDHVAVRMWRDIRDRGWSCGVRGLGRLWVYGGRGAIRRARCKGNAVLASGGSGAGRRWRGGGAILAPGLLRIALQGRLDKGCGHHLVPEGQVDPPTRRVVIRWCSVEKLLLACP